VTTTFLPVVQLKQCARCQQVWFCGKVYLTKAWKKSNKFTCLKPSGVAACRDVDEAAIEADFEQLGGVTFTSTGVGESPYVILAMIVNTVRIGEMDEWAFENTEFLLKVSCLCSRWRWRIL